MVDLKKELSFSDLIPKLPAKKPKPISAAATKRRPMPPELVGLKIEAAGVTAAHVVNNGGRRLVQLVRTPLAAGHRRQRRGARSRRVSRPRSTSSSAPTICPGAASASGSRTPASASASSRSPASSDLPQLENAISFRAHEILSVPLDEAVLDYHVLSTSTGEDGVVSYRILLVVAYKDSVDRYLAATDAAGIEVAGIDLDAFALLRALPRRDERPIDRSRARPPWRRYRSTTT